MALDTHVHFDPSSRLVMGYALVWNVVAHGSRLKDGRPAAFWADGHYPYVFRKGSGDENTNGTPLLADHDANQHVGWIEAAHRTRAGLYIVGRLFNPSPDDDLDAIGLRASAGQLFFSAGGVYNLEAGAPGRLKGGHIHEVSLTMYPGIEPRPDREALANARIDRLIEALDHIQEFLE